MNAIKISLNPDRKNYNPSGHGHFWWRRRELKLTRHENHFLRLSIFTFLDLSLGSSSSVTRFEVKAIRVNK